MADLPSTFTKVNDVEVGPDKPITEALLTKLGQNDNYLYDNLNTEITTRSTDDINLQSQVTAIKNQVNADLINIPRVVETGTIDLSPDDIGVAQRVAAIWFEKRNGADKTFIAIQVFNDDGDDMLIDEYHEIVGRSPSTWDFGVWYHDKNNLDIIWTLYKNVSVVVP
jgi:hypothetical protein